MGVTKGDTRSLDCLSNEGLFKAGPESQMMIDWPAE